jgi:hypothetical protein
MRVIDFIDFAGDLPVALKQSGVKAHIDQTTRDMGWTHKAGTVHFGLQPQTGHQGAVDEKSVFHEVDFASLRAKRGNPVHFPSLRAKRGNPVPAQALHWIAASQAPRDDGTSRHCERSAAIQCLRKRLVMTGVAVFNGPWAQIPTLRQGLNCSERSKRDPHAHD